MKQKIRLTVIILSILLSGSLLYYFVLARLFVPKYPYQNETGLTKEAYFNAYSLPAFVINYSGNPNLTISKSFTTGFESWDDFSAFYKTPQNARFSTSHAITNEHVHSGSMAHKAYVYNYNIILPNENTNHRGYPTIQLYKSNVGVLHTMYMLDFWVWLDINLKYRENQEWFSLATLTAYADDYWYRSYLINLNKDYTVDCMHVPDNGKAEFLFENNTIKFPMKEWVRITALVDLTNSNKFNRSYISVWQDEQLVSVGALNDRINPLIMTENQLPDCLKNWDQKNLTEAERLCGLNYTGGLAQAHFGMYCPPLINKALVFNDDLILAELR